VIFILSVKAGLRAKEIASLTCRMVTDARGQIGQAIHLENSASKGQSGRVIPMNLIFAHGGWRRSSVLGKDQADVDLILTQPTIGENAWVQIKISSISDST
jgi:hypothetical protein